MRNAIATISGVLFIIGFIPYILAILKGVSETRPMSPLSTVFRLLGKIPGCSKFLEQTEGIRPSKVTWLIWASLDTITIWGMHKKETLNPQIIAAVLGAWIIVALVLKYGTKEWSKTDKFCLGGAILAVFLWNVFGNATVGIVTSNIVVFLGSYTMFKSSWKKPRDESKLAWTIWWVSCFCAVITIPAWTLADAVQPLTFFVIETIMMYIVYIRPITLKTAP